MPSAGPLPNVFVVGDAKCGTTSIHRIFELSPGIGTPRTRKELHFFSAPELVAATNGPGDDRIPPAIVQTEAEYRAEFAHLPPGLPAIADVSPSYLRNPAAAARLHAFAPEARILILLREPAARVRARTGTCPARLPMISGSRRRGGRVVEGARLESV